MVRRIDEGFKAGAKENRMLSKIYSVYNAIEHSNDLRKHGLSLSDYRAFPDVFQQLQNIGYAETFVKSLADFFKKNGFGVSMGDDGVNYVITFDGGVRESKKRSLKKTMKESSVRGDYCGIPGIKFVSNGEWADGGLVFDGKYFNVHDVEDAMWDMFNEYCDETGVICDDDGFEDYMRENEDTVKGLLYDLIEYGQYEDLDEVPVFGPFKKSYRRDRGDHPGDYIEFESVRLKRESTNKRRPTSKKKNK